jgi:hypothetical protein
MKRMENMTRLTRFSTVLALIILAGASCSDGKGHEDADADDSIDTPLDEAAEGDPDVPVDDGEGDGDADDDGLVPEICGNGVDDDGNGLADCLDPACALDPSCPAWCEAASGSSCYYVDAARGDDGNDGSFENPWRTYLNAVVYYGTPGENGSTPPPAGHVALQPGDAIYFFDGVYEATFNYNGRTEAFFVRGLDGDEDHPYRLAAYPGQSPRFTPAEDATAVHILQSAWWIVEGIEVDGAWQNGVWVAESDHVVLRNLLIHDVDGVDNHNIAGLHILGATNVELVDSVLHDNFDRTAEDTGGEPTENSSNVVIFGGGFITLEGNHIYNTPDTSEGMHGACIKYKHMRSVDGGTFTVRGNRLEHCRFYSVATGSPDSLITGNLILDSATVTLKDLGGPTELRRIHVQYNTFVRTPALRMDTEDGDPDPEDIAYDHNAVLDDATSYNQESAMVTISPYRSDAMFAVVTAPGVLTFESNCYGNPSTDPLFALFAAGGSWGDAGDLYTFTEWQALGYDESSHAVDPAFDADHAPTAVECLDTGHTRAPSP